MDRQGVLDNLTSIENTATLLLNALTRNDEKDHRFTFDGIHRQELLIQTTDFLGHAQKLILQLSESLNLSSNILNEKNESPSMTFDEILSKNLTINDLCPHYPQFHRSSSPDLQTLIRSIRQIDQLDEVIWKVYQTIFTEDERLFCNHDGSEGKLSYPLSKEMLFERLIKLIEYERHTIITDEDQRKFYFKFEKENSLTKKIVPLKFDHLPQNDEKQWIIEMFHRVLSSDEVKSILRAHEQFQSPFNRIEMFFHQMKLSNLYQIKQKWFEFYPKSDWSQCLQWVFQSLNQWKTSRSSKRKGRESLTEQKRTKTMLTFEEQCEKIDRRNYDVFEYADQLLNFISIENKKIYPNYEQLKSLEETIFRFYWTSNRDETWAKILQMINSIFHCSTNEKDFQEIYFKYLHEHHPTDLKEIQRLLQISSFSTCTFSV